MSLLKRLVKAIPGTKWLYDTFFTAVRESTALVEALLANIVLAVYRPRYIAIEDLPGIPHFPKTLSRLPFLQRYSVVNNSPVLKALKKVFFTDQDTRAGWIGSGLPLTFAKEGKSLAKMAGEHLAMYLSCLTNISESTDRKFSILDVGCGFGYITKCLADAWPRAEFVGVDYDTKAIQFAKRVNSGGNIQYLNQDFLFYESKKRHEYIFLVDVLEHIPAHKHNSFIDHCLHHLKDDGQLFVITPNAVFEEDGDHAHIGMLNSSRIRAFTNRYKKNFLEESFILDKKLNLLNPGKFVVEAPLSEYRRFQEKGTTNYTSHIRVVMKKNGQTKLGGKG